MIKSGGEGGAIAYIDKGSKKRGVMIVSKSWYWEQTEKRERERE